MYKLKLISGCKWKEKGLIGYPVVVVAGKKYG